MIRAMQLMLRNPKVLFLAISLVSLAANIYLSFTLWKTVSQSPQAELAHEVEQYPYLSKRIFVENPNDLIVNFIGLRDALNVYVAKIKTGTLGVYFEYLPTGNSIGVNEKQEFPLASLIKIPLAMAAYDLVDKGKLSLDEELIITENEINKDFGTLWQKGVGFKLTVRDAIRYALSESDNTATLALYHRVGTDVFVRVFDYLDLTPEIQHNLVLLTPKSYSSIFRSLYISSYLPNNFSHEILKIMTDSPFQDKIVAGVPKDVRVSHKIGFRGSSVASEEVFSDCGIVYVPNRPYLLCMISQGIPESTVNVIMKNISKMIYTYLTQIAQK